MVLLGGSTFMNALAGVNIYAASFLNTSWCEYLHPSRKAESHFFGYLYTFCNGCAIINQYIGFIFEKKQNIVDLKLFFSTQFIVFLLLQCGISHSYIRASIFGKKPIYRTDFKLILVIRIW